jgi:hypothetical protein
MMMTYEEVRRAILDLDLNDQKRLFTDVMPLIWPKACTDDECLSRVRELVDEEAVAEYRRQNMGGI